MCGSLASFEWCLVCTSRQSTTPPLAGVRCVHPRQQRQRGRCKTVLTCMSAVLADCGCDL